MSFAAYSNRRGRLHVVLGEARNQTTHLSIRYTTGQVIQLAGNFGRRH